MAPEDFCRAHPELFHVAFAASWKGILRNGLWSAEELTRRLLPLVEKFFAERIFGPMRLDKLARQLRAHQKASRKDLGAKQRQLRDRVADLDRRIGLQITASSKTSSPNSSASGSPNFERTRRAPRSDSAPSDQSEPILSHRRTSESSWSACPTSPPPCTMPHRPSSARSSTPSASRSPTTSPAAASRSQPRSPSRSPRPSPTRRASRRRPLIAPSSLKGT